MPKDQQEPVIIDMQLISEYIQAKLAADNSEAPVKIAEDHLEDFNDKFKDQTKDEDIQQMLTEVKGQFERSKAERDASIKRFNEIENKIKDIIKKANGAPIIRRVWEGMAKVPTYKTFTFTLVDGKVKLTDTNTEIKEDE